MRWLVWGRRAEGWTDRKVGRCSSWELVCRRAGMPRVMIEAGMRDGVQIPASFASGPGLSHAAKKGPLNGDPSLHKSLSRSQPPFERSVGAEEVGLLEPDGSHCHEGPTTWRLRLLGRRRCTAWQHLTQFECIDPYRSTMLLNCRSSSRGVLGRYSVQMPKLTITCVKVHHHLHAAHG